MDEIINYDYVLHKYVKEMGLVSHHINPFNLFIGKEGATEIAKTGFGKIEYKDYDTKRDKTEEDNKIKSISFEIEIINLELDKPKSIEYTSGLPKLQFPNEARKSDKTYSSMMRMDAKVHAYATLKDGTIMEKESIEVQKQYIGSVPIMVGSVKCNTYGMSSEQLKNIEEDPSDPGGYLIIKGNEYAVIGLENITLNKFHAYRNMYQNEIARGEFISKPGDGFENSFQIRAKCLNSGTIVLEIMSTVFAELKNMPFYIIYRAFGMTNDKEIIESIMYDINANDTISIAIRKELKTAMSTTDDNNFKPLKNNINPNEILEMIWGEMNPLRREDKNINVSYKINTAINLLDKYFLPHIGIKPENRYNKLMYFGSLIRKLLLVKLELVPGTDRDSYRNKRVHTAGITIAKAFKTQFNFNVVRPLKDAYRNAFKNTQFSEVNLRNVFKGALKKTNELEAGIVKYITSSKQQLKQGTMVTKNRVSSKLLERKSQLSVISTLRNIDASGGNASKSSDRAEELRAVHGTHIGSICIIQTAETGEKVGKQRQMAYGATITDATNSDAVKKMLSEDITPINQTNLQEILSGKQTKIYVNGDWIGTTNDYQFILKKYRGLRQKNLIHKHTSIIKDLINNEINFWTDNGRMVIPLLKVHSNIDELQPKDIKNKFKQQLKLTQKQFIQLMRNEITCEDLYLNGVIEYITQDEFDNYYVADSYAVLQKNEKNYLQQYTHCLFPRQIFGLPALCVPFTEKAPQNRSAFETSQVRQTNGWYSFAYPYRYYKNTFLQHKCQKPLCDTISSEYTMPGGKNVLVAVMMYGGYNQEDSLVFNKASLDRGAFDGSFYTNIVTIVESGEYIGNPDYANTMNISKSRSYQHLINGLPKIGSVISKNDIVIGKFADNIKTNKKKYIDKSVPYTHNEEVTVVDVIDTHNNDDKRLIKVRLRSFRQVQVGDKFSARSGNKGICGAIYDQSEMPCTEEGLIPDCILNVCALPTRMVVNQPIEGAYSLLNAHYGRFTDATAFQNYNVENIYEQLDEIGYPDGTHTMYCGKTGEQIEAKIYMVPNYYQRLAKFIKDISNASSFNSNMNITTFQPQKGYMTGGSLRMGEMEQAVLVAQGSAHILGEKFYDHSDGTTNYICRKCGNRATVNEIHSIYRCKICGSNADICKIHSSKTSKLVSDILTNSGLKQEYIMEQPIFEELE